MKMNVNIETERLLVLEFVGGGAVMPGDSAKDGEDVDEWADDGEDIGVIADGETALILSLVIIFLNLQMIYTNHKVERKPNLFFHINE